jgi:Uma2 family endonuclease
MTVEQPHTRVQLLFSLNGGSDADGADGAVVVTPRRFTVDEYHRMGEAGILGEDDRVELVEGELVQMTAIGSPHMGCVNFLNRLLVRACGDKAIVSVQNSVRLDQHSEPQPDIVLFRPRDDFYVHQIPLARDVFLILEVSDTSLRYDRGVKLPLYARGGIPEAWIVDLQNRRLERYTKPADGIYQAIARAGSGEHLPSTVLPEIILVVDDLIRTQM